MKKARSKNTPPSTKGAAVSKPRISGTRLWVFRIAAMVFVPLLFLAILEIGLRVAGVGHPTSFFLPMRVNGQDCLVENDRFGWRFFGPEMARTPQPFVIPRDKAPDTVRVFVFGESAAFGDPQPEFGLSRILQALLEGRYPGKHFEVVNSAMTAINSHVILPIAKDCAKENGDIWIIYMGNNEVVGPYGAGTVFGAKAPNLELVRANVALKATRIGQALGILARRAQKRTANQSEWGGMEMFENSHVAHDDARMQTVYSSFEHNLNDIINAGTGSGAKVYVSTVIRNLKDCGPFASDHRAGLSGDESAEWQTIYQSGIKDQQAGQEAEAAKDFQNAIKLDDGFAEEHFRLGQCLLKLGRDSEAADEFAKACDDDTLRFRADSRINEIIRRVAVNRKDGVELVDAEAAGLAASPHHLTGSELLYEHVHLNFEGNYLLARAFAEQVSRVQGGGDPRAWCSPAECAARLGWNDFTRRKGEMEILSRFNNPPFNQQANHEEQYQRLARQIESLQTAIAPESLRVAVAQAKAAADASPNDWILEMNLAELQQKAGDVAGAVDSLQHEVKLLPQSADSWQRLGIALETAKRDTEASAAFQQAFRLQPESMVSLDSLAELHARDGHTEDAAREFQEILRAKPYWGPAHLGLGKTLETMGKTNEANVEFQEAFKNRIISPESFNTLGRFAFSRGWYDVAATNFNDSLKLYPGDAEAHFYLGQALDHLGHRADAKAHFAEAVRLQPDFATAHFCLGLELGQDGDAAGAAAQFAETVRLMPDLLEARINLGVALENERLDQQALEQFNEVLRRDPQNRAALEHVRKLHVGSARQ